jgi:VWFA-related protein
LPAAGPEDASSAQKPHVLGTYSNQPAETANQSWNIILFDMLNTPLEDQKTARNQLQKIAASLPAGQPVALFLLTGKLVMVQGFTRDPNAMLLAVKQLQTQRSQVLTTEAERQQEIGQATYIAETMTPSVPGVAGVNPQTISDFQSNMASNMLEQTKNLESIRIDERAIFTLDAFAGLARSLAGYPGRKNLIWLSGDFPVRVEPGNSGDKWRYSTGYIDRLSQTDALLTQSRVAVYPVDIRGMQMRGVDIATSTQQVTAFVGGNGGSTPSTSPDRSTDLTASQGITSMNERETMMEVAEQTGGHAFINTNDFNRAIATAIEDGSIYYTIAYSPDSKDDKPTYHKIEVQLNHPGAKLSYRRGYYSQPESATQKTGLAALQGSLQPGMPTSTMLFFTASVKHSDAKTPDAKSKTVEIDYVINGSNVTLADAANGGKHVLVDCMVVAYDREGKVAAHASDTLDGTLPATAVQATLARGLPASEELELKPGVYNLRLGVQDRDSQRIGTLTVPITVE